MLSDRGIKRARRWIYLVGFAFCVVFWMVAFDFSFDTKKLHSVSTAIESNAVASNLAPESHHYSNSMTINTVRVTLLSIGHETVMMPNDAGAITAVSCLQITYTCEILGHEPIKNWNQGPTEIEVNGERAHTNFVNTISYNVDRMPGGPWKVNVTDATRATGTRTWFREDGLSPGLATLRLHLGVNGKSEVFQFDALPIR